MDRNAARRSNCSKGGSLETPISELPLSNLTTGATTMKGKTMTKLLSIAVSRLFGRTHNGFVSQQTANTGANAASLDESRRMAHADERGEGRQLAVNLLKDLREKWREMDDADRLTFPHADFVSEYLGAVLGRDPQTRKDFYAILSDVLLEAASGESVPPKPEFYEGLTSGPTARANLTRAEHNAQDRKAGQAIREGIEKEAAEQQAERRRRQTREEKEAAEILGAFPSEIYALDDMARRLHKSPLSCWTVYYSVKGIVASLDRRLTEAADALPKKHKAIKVILAAAPMLESLRELILNAEEDSGSWNMSKEALGAGMLAIVQAIARQFERAIIACGNAETSGYLTGDDFDPCADPKAAASA